MTMITICVLILLSQFLIITLMEVFKIMIGQPWTALRLIQHQSVQFPDADAFFGKEAFSIFNADAFSKQPGAGSQGFNEFRVRQIGLRLGAVWIMELCFICPDGLHPLFPN